MDFFTAADVLASGLTAERTLMNTTSSNLANAQTTRTQEGGPYKRLDPVFETKATFNEELDAQLAPGVSVSEIRSDGSAPRIVHDPGHPDADKDGNVALPNVNMVEEMVNMIQASRAYEAGVKAMGTLSAMAERAIGIGK